MVRIYTLTLAPSLDSATLTPQIYPEGKLRCSAPVFEPGGGGINVARAIVHLGGSATALFPAGGATGEHLVSLLHDEQVAVETISARDWTRQNLHVHVESTGEQYRFVMPGAALTDDELRQLEEKVLAIEPGAILVISGSLPPGVGVEKLQQLIKAARQKGIRLIVDSSGDALAAALDVGDIELVKPNQKELAALVKRSLDAPDDVRQAAMNSSSRAKPPRGGLAGAAGRARRGRQRLRAGRAAANEKPEHRRRGRQHGRRHDAAARAGRPAAGYGALRRGRRQCRHHQSGHATLLAGKHRPHLPLAQTLTFRPASGLAFHC